MKKLTLLTLLLLCITIVYSSCTKEKVSPTGVKTHQNVLKDGDGSGDEDPPVKPPVDND